MASEVTDSTDAARASGEDHRAGVARHLPLEPGAHEGAPGCLRRGTALPLHVGTHEGAVGVVVLQERDEGRGRRAHQLQRGEVDVDLDGLLRLHFTRVDDGEVAAVPARAGRSGSRG